MRRAPRRVSAWRTMCGLYLLESNGHAYGAENKKKLIQSVRLSGRRPALQYRAWFTGQPDAAPAGR